jgi:hypothetical protein
MHTHILGQSFAPGRPCVSCSPRVGNLCWSRLSRSTLTNLRGWDGGPRASDLDLSAHTIGSRCCATDTELNSWETLSAMFTLVREPLWSLGLFRLTLITLCRWDGGPQASDPDFCTHIRVRSMFILYTHSRTYLRSVYILYTYSRTGVHFLCADWGVCFSGLAGRRRQQVPSDGVLRMAPCQLEPRTRVHHTRRNRRFPGAPAYVRCSYEMN